MDFSQISIAATSLGMARDIAKVAMGLRDFNQLAATVSQLNEQLLKAQDALFAHNSQMLALQQEHFDTTEKLRKLEETISERARYKLFELTEGFFVYRFDPPPNGATESDPILAEPLHHLCQQCFDSSGTKSVLLIRHNYCKCFLCKTELIIDVAAAQERSRAARRQLVSSLPR